MGAVWLLLGLVPLLVAAHLGARHAFRVEAGPPRVLAASVLAWGWVTVGVEVVGNLGQLDPPTLVGWSVAGLVVAGLVAFVRPAAADIAPPREAMGPWAILATGLVGWAALRLGLISVVFPVKVVSDGPIYHLYMAARWWKAGRLFLVATPFGELGATYFWANGELWYSWLLTLSGGDRVARIGQVPFLILGGMAIEAIARHLGTRASAARLAACWFVAITPELIFAFEPNVDSILIAGYLLGVYFFLRAFTSSEPLSVRALILGSLAAGLGMGTKPTGIVFFPPVLALVVVGLVWRWWGHWRSGLLSVIAAVLPALAMMGYWPIRNALLTGNPLYPIQIEAMGRVWFAGWFAPGAMHQSPYYIPWQNWRACWDIILSVCDPRELPVWLASLVGVWAIRRPRTTDDRVTDRWVWGFAGLALFNLAAYWLVIPYRSQQRFSFPALALLAIPLARLFDRAGWVRGLAVVLLAGHLITPQTWPIAAREAEIPWDGQAMIPNAVPGAIDFPTTQADWRQQIQRPGFWATGLLGVGALGTVAWWRVRRWVAVVWLLPCVVGSAELINARAGIAFPYFADYIVGWTVLEARAGRQGARIAYAGHKIPYYLMGSNLQNDVQYVNIDQHRDWLLHDYFQHAASSGDPTLWPNPFPAWGRLHPDYTAWLANLRAARIDLLVVTRVNVEEGVENVADRDLFPIERVWAESHPEAFRPIYGVVENDPRFKIFQVKPGI